MANRFQTFAIVKSCGVTPFSTSFQVSGVETDRAGLGADRVHGRDVGAGAVHVVVDEYLPRAALDPPGHRHALAVGLLDQPSHRADEVADLLVGVAGFDRHEDLHTGRSARLRVAAEAECLERRLHVKGNGQYVLEARPHRVEIEEEVVGFVDRRASRMQRMELDAAEVRDVEQTGGVLHHEVADHAVAAVLGEHVAARDPVRRVRGRGLLVEEVARDAVGHPFHRERPLGEMGKDQWCDVEVVGDEVALRVALVGPEDLVEVRQAKLTAVDVHPPGIAALLRRQRSRVLHGERWPARALLPRRHPEMVDAGARSRVPVTGAV